MFEKVCILLTHVESKPLKVFFGKKLMRKYIEISNISELKSFNDMWMVNEHSDLLAQLINSKNPITSLNALRVLQTKIESEKSLAAPSWQNLRQVTFSSSSNRMANSQFRDSNEKLESSFTFLLENVGEYSRPDAYIEGISGFDDSPYHAHETRLKDLIQFIEENHFSVYDEKANNCVRVLLSATGDSLRVFIKRNTYNSHYNCNDYMEVSNSSELDKSIFSDLWIVKQHRGLLEQLISSRGPEAILDSFGSIKKEIDLELQQKSEGIGIHSQNNRLRTSFTFMHEQTTEHPGHHKEPVDMTFRSPGHILYSVSGHMDTLDEAIQFVEEFRLDRCKDSSRRSYVDGYRYEKSTWLALPAWTVYLMSQRNNEDFNRGREQAREAAKLKM